MDVAAEFGVNTVSLWLGQDGFDYVFQADYVAAWQNLVDRLAQGSLAIARILTWVLNTRPANHKWLAMSIQAVKRWLWPRPPAKTMWVSPWMSAMPSMPVKIRPKMAAFLLGSKRLFHIHLNDNYSWADDDMPVGTVHFLQFAELFYWMEQAEYDGWMSLDLYPYREDPSEACQTSVHFVNKMQKLARDADFQKLVDENRASGSRAIRKIYQLLLGE